VKVKRNKSGKIAVVHVLGCKVNQAEAAAMARVLAGQGYTVEADGSNPDLIVVNTCCVTSRAEGKSRRLVHRLAKEYPRARLIVTGCLAEIHAESIRGVSANQHVLAPWIRIVLRSLQRKRPRIAPRRRHLGSPRRVSLAISLPRGLRDEPGRT